MIIASTLFLIIGIVTFVIGVVASEDVGLIVVSIGASLLAAVTLAVGVVRDRRRLAAEGLEPSEASMFTEAPTEYAPIMRTEPEPITPLTEPEAVAPLTLAPDEDLVPVRESASVRAARASVAKTAAKRTTAKKTTKKPAAKKPAARKPAAKKPAAKKPAAKKTAAKKTAAKKPAAKKSPAKKTTKAAAEPPETPRETPPPSG